MRCGTGDVLRERGWGDDVETVEMVNLELKGNSNKTRLCICRMIREVQWADHETQHRRQGGILRGFGRVCGRVCLEFSVLEMS